MKYLVNFNIGHLIYSPYIIVHQYCGQKGLKCQERFNVSQKSITSRCPLYYPKFTFKNSMKYFGVKSAKLCSGRMAIDVIPTIWYIEFGKRKKLCHAIYKKTSHHFFLFIFFWRNIVVNKCCCLKIGHNKMELTVPIIAKGRVKTYNACNFFRRTSRKLVELISSSLFDAQPSCCNVTATRFLLNGLQFLLLVFSLFLILLVE